MSAVISSSIRCDAHGLPLATDQDSSVAAWNAALAQFNSLRLDPVETLQAALADDPGFIDAHQALAALMLSAIDGQLLPQARLHLAAAAACDRSPDLRQRSLQAALAIWAAGDMPGANRLLDRHLVDHPRDLLALQLTHMQDLVLGQTALLRDRIGRALSAWSADDSCWGYLLGMQAFGLEECGEYARAEALGREAVALHADDAWAVHAVAHVCEMQGRPRDGVHWLGSETALWSDANALAVHNHWHLALFHLQLRDLDGALALYDRAMAPGPASLALDLVDASALLWRLMLLGRTDLAARWQALAQRWAEQADWGWFAFNDMHALMALVGVGDDAAARAALARIESAAAQPRAAPVWPTVALPVARALVAFGHGQFAACAHNLLPVIGVTAPLGGSHAQRSVLPLTAGEAARRAGDLALVRALASEAAARHEKAR